jgi:hypothetical protein
MNIADNRWTKLGKSDSHQDDDVLNPSDFRPSLGGYRKVRRMDSRHRIHAQKLE